MAGDWGESGEGVDDSLTRPIIVGQYRLDLLVQGTVIVEVKVVEALSKVPYSQAR